ncbi:MAG: hypothetical protein Q4P66_08660, partial [Actinomycetaceae bacterium]|nr:hypothetical protein [Actinomycetaceae bacterium]
MTNQVPMQPQPMQPQPGMPMGQPVQPPETKSKLSMIALALCIVCCLIMLIGSYVSVSGLNFDDVTLENADKMLQAAQAAQNTQIIVFLIAGILNL